MPVFQEFRVSFPGLKAGACGGPFYWPECLFLFNFKALEEPLHLLERDFPDLGGGPGPLEFQPVKKFFGRQDKSVPVIPENLDGVFSFIAEDEHIIFLERIQPELEADHGGQSRNLLTEVGRPAGQKNTVSPCGHMPHHSCFITWSSFSSVSGWKPSGM